MDERFEKGGPLPNSVGALADLYVETRELRLGVDKVSQALHARETEIRGVILRALEEGPDTGASGEKQRVQLVTKTVRNVKDWNTFWTWVAQHGQWQLLGKRANTVALREMQEEYQQLPPGVVAEDIPDLSFSKVG